MKKLTELDKLKHWVDVEFSMTRVFFSAILWLLTTNAVVHILLGLYIAYSLLRAFTKVATIAADDPNYLKTPQE